jgi:translation initiation factor IF-1
MRPPRCAGRRARTTLPRTRRPCSNGERLLVPVDDVVPREAGGDADHSKNNSAGEHDTLFDPARAQGVPLRRAQPAAETGTARRPSRANCLRGANACTKHPTPVEGVPIPPPRRRKGGGGKKRREPLTPVVKEDTLSLVGRVVETFPSSTFKVELENGHTILASLAGRLRRFRIRITPGDDVDVELSPYDLTRGRITYRRQGRNA